MGYIKKLLDGIYQQFFVRYGLPAKNYSLGFYWDSLILFTRPGFDREPSSVVRIQLADQMCSDKDLMQ